jgi:2'-5' RNA ligase
VPADNVHLTLAFVGAWPQSQLASLFAAGHSLDGQTMHVTLDLHGAFRRTGIAWIGASSPPVALADLATALAGALRANGVPYDERSFRPHVTLARRCRGPWPHGACEPLAWDVDSFALMASETRTEGARYTRLAGWPLRDANA